ncbi:MAG TPA: helix-turn-helix domain-containing protein [Candidatus Paceibacterota bacterium]
MDNILNSLEYLGLAPKEARIYIALLELGEGTVIDIAKKIGMKRTSVYNILPNLMKRRLIKTSSRGKHRVFFVEDVSPFTIDINEKIKIVEKILPELRAMQNILPLKPRITFYEAFEGTKDLYQDTLESCASGDTILSYTGLFDFHTYMPREFERAYIEERVKKKIRIKIIAPRSKVAGEWAHNGPKELRETRLINSSQFRFNADMEIYANKIALISYRENFLGVIIESTEINKMQRMAFELMWNSLRA